MLHNVSLFVRQENIDFIALFEASQWSQAECARRLKTTPATISRYLTQEPEKQIMPSPGTIELFKFILASERPGALTAASATGTAREESLADWERKVVEDLRWLHKDDRRRVLVAIKAIVEALPKRPPINYNSGKKPPKDIQGVSSKIADVATASQASASELARRELQEQQQKPKAAEPSGNKHEQARGGLRGSKRKPESQG